MAIRAATDGLGIGLESLLLIQRELATGQLVLPFGPSGPRLVCHRLLFLRAKQDVPKIRMFRTWILDQLHQRPG